MCERELETEQNCNILTPHSYGHQRFPFSCAAQPEAWGPSFSGTCSSIQHLISNGSGLQTAQSGAWGLLLLAFSTASCLQTKLVSKLTDFLSSPSYIIVQRPLLLVGVTIALIQPIHGQGYNFDIPRPDAPVIYIGAFPILTARPGRMSVHNKNRSSQNLTTSSIDVSSSFPVTAGSFRVNLKIQRWQKETTKHKFVLEYIEGESNI